MAHGLHIPVELDYELASIRRTDFDGTLEAGFTGHPHFDPLTGEHHALAYEPFQPVRYISVDHDGRAATRARIDLPHIPLIHDMAFTRSFIVVPDFPVTIEQGPSKPALAIQASGDSGLPAFGIGPSAPPCVPRGYGVRTAVP